MKEVCKNGNGTVPSTVIMSPEDSQVMKNLGKDNCVLYDLVDLAKMFKVTKRTLYNWRANGGLPLFEVGGKLYMTHKMLSDLLEKKEGDAK